MIGTTDKAGTGAIGDARGVVQNVAPLCDREVIFDGSGDDTDAPFTDWAAMNADTLNVVSDLNHIRGRFAIEFDKVAGAPTTIFAALVNDSLNLDCSRFLQTDEIEALFQIPDLTNVAYVAIRLGTDATNYNEWRMADTAITAAVWQKFSARVSECEIAVVGNGWDPKTVTYCAFVVAFDAAANALADMFLDSIEIVGFPGGDEELADIGDALDDIVTATEAVGDASAVHLAAGPTRAVLTGGLTVDGVPVAEAAGDIAAPWLDLFRRLVPYGANLGEGTLDVSVQSTPGKPVPLIETGWVALTAPAAVTPTIDVRNWANIVVAFQVVPAGMTDMDYIIWGSIDGVIFFILDEDNLTAAEVAAFGADGTGSVVIPTVQINYLYCEFEAENGGAPTILFQVAGGN